MAREIKLEDLHTMAPALSKKRADAFAESCMVSLDLQGHTSGVGLLIAFEDSVETVILSREDEVTDNIRNAHNVLEERVDKAACAVALLLLPEFAGLYAVQASLKWSGFDYYLSPEADDDTFFLNHTAVLEVSGIQAETRGNTVTRRANAKRRRVEHYKTKL